MPYKDKEKQREYQRRWAKAKRDKLISDESTAEDFYKAKRLANRKYRTTLRGKKTEGEYRDSGRKRNREYNRKLQRLLEVKAELDNLKIGYE